MSTQIENPIKSIDKQSTAYQSYVEAAGLVGMPLADRNHFEPGQKAPVAVSPDETVGRPAVVVPENP